MKAICALLILVTMVAASASARETLLAPGLYRAPDGHFVYVGIEYELPDARINEFFDSNTQRFYNDFPQRLTMVRSVREERRIVHAPQGPLGTSLWYAGEGARPAIILVHGNDPETREMGFLVSYFVTNGVNVISYDQRGTGESSGSWSMNGPVARAQDVDAVVDAFATDRHVDRSSIGVFGFSNGGWTAPIVTTQRHMAFMILKSASAESLESNIMYEIKERMLYHHFDDAQIRDAQHTWQVLLAYLNGHASAAEAQTVYDRATRQPWVKAMFLPEHLRFPLPAETAAGFRRAVMYDPEPVLKTVRTPTLALFGVLDRNVDVSHASVTFASAFKEAGMDDFTMHVYRHAGHQLKVSSSGYNGDVDPPERFVPEYPSVMLDWLRKEGILR